MNTKLRWSRAIGAAALLVTSTARAQAPQALTVDELRRVHAVATNLSASAPRCVAVPEGETPPQQNLAAEAIHEQVAAMLGMLTLKYPRGRESAEDRIAVLEDLLSAAIQAHREAHGCHSEGEGARHIRAALALVASFERMLQFQEKLPANAAPFTALEQRRGSLRAELPPPTKCEAKAKCAATATAPAGPDEKSYRARGLGRSFLRAELGFGVGRVKFSDYISTTDGSGVITPVATTEDVLGPAFRLSAGLRQLAGKRDRHVLLIGGFYSLQHVASSRNNNNNSELMKYDSVFRIVHGGGLTFEWGIRLREGVVSLHPGAEFGLQALLIGSTFGQLRVGGSFGVCFSQELFCVTARVQRHLQATVGRTFYGVQALLGIDLMRLIDRGVAARSWR